MTFPNKIFH